MTQRIRMIDVNDRLYRLNEKMGRATTAWSSAGSNIGNYHLYAANGCYSLHVIANDKGRVHSLFTGTLREVYIYVCGMLHAAYEMESSNATA